MEFSVHNLVKWFQLKHPKIVKSMKESNHHYSEQYLSPYHLESDVFTHTMMVVLEASKIKYDKNFDMHLLICALLHDIGKPIARRENHEKKIVHFYSHEPLSAFLAISILEDIEDDFEVVLDKRLILEAISMHTEVFKLEEGKLTERLIGNRRLALLLSRLSKSDHHGRFYDMGDRITHDMIPKTMNILEPKTSKVLMMVGLPCAGKSTFIKKKLAESDDWVVLSSDDVVVQLGSEMGITNYNEAFMKVNHDEVKRILTDRKEKYIKENKNVIVDMTNTSRKTRRKMLNDFPDNYMRSANVIMTNMESIIFRNNERGGRVIPEEVYERMMMSFYPPLYDEFDEIKWEFN